MLYKSQIVQSATSKLEQMPIDFPEENSVLALKSQLEKAIEENRQLRYEAQLMYIPNIHIKI